MSLESIYFLSQISAAAAVVGSLLYLAVQVRNSNAQGRAAARYAFVQAMGEVNLAIAQEKETASVFRRGLESSDALDDDERMQLWMIVGQYANTWSVMYELHEDGMLPDKQWWAVRKDMLSVLTSQGGRVFWKLFGVKGFDPAFVKYVDSLINEGEESYELLAKEGAA